MLHDAPPASQNQPIYQDRTSGVTYRDAFEMVNVYLQRLSTRTEHQPEPLDATGYTQLKRGSAYLGVNVLEDNGVLMILSPVMQVPFASREQFYRKLLELSFLATSDAAFAIDAGKDVLYVRALRRLSALDYEEFEDLILTVGQVADEWDDKLKAEFEA